MFFILCYGFDMFVHKKHSPCITLFGHSVSQITKEPGGRGGNYAKSPDPIALYFQSACGYLLAQHVMKGLWYAVRWYVYYPVGTEGLCSAAGQLVEWCIHARLKYHDAKLTNVEG